MPIPSIAQLAKRRQDLLTTRSTFESQWQDIGDYIVPGKRNVQQRQPTPGEKQTERLFDSTAIHSHLLLASSLHGTMTPSTQPWLSLVMRQDELNEQQTVKAWLEDAAQRLHKALKQSNFNTAVHEMYIDLTSFGTGCLFVEEKDPDRLGGFGGFRFKAFPVGEYAISENWEGVVDTLFRDLKPTARACVQHWGDRCSEVVKEQARTKPDQPVHVVHAVFPRTERDVTKSNKTNKPFASVYFELERKHKLEEGGFEEFPYLVPRWNKTSGEAYGRGPSHTALPDIKSLNQLKEDILKAIPLAIAPPSLERDDSVVGDLDMTPFGRNVVSGTGPLADMLMRLETGFKPDLANFSLQDLRIAIKDMYFVQQLELQDGPQMTATEVQVRYELMQRLLGPTVGRLETEFLNPLVERCFALMARANAFQELPPELQELGGEADLDIEYEGPLARAQRTVEVVAQDRLIAFVQMVSGALAVVDPAAARAVWDVLEMDDMVRDRAEVLGVPVTQLADQEKVRYVRDRRDEAAAAQQDLQTGMQVAEAAGKAAPMVRELKPQPAGAAA